MTLYAWNGYKKYAWGKNELRPMTKTSFSPSTLGKNGQNLGLTIVESLDTLCMMNLENEFNLGRDWIEEHFDINIV